MAQSGVKIAQDVVGEYGDMKMKKKISYMILTIKDKMVIEIDLKGDPYPGGKNDAVDEAVSREYFEKLKTEVKELKTPCYILFDARVDKKEGGNSDKIVFYAWSPDDKFTVKEKMLYSSSKDGLTKKLEGLSAKYQANELSDLDFDAIKADINK